MLTALMTTVKELSNETATILVIEDEPEIAELLATHIRHAGYIVHVQDRGLAGLTSAQAERPDLILLDLMLPDVDGLEVCRELQRSDVTNTIPIIMVTARGEESDIVQGLELGASDYITKPFSAKVLMARIRKALKLEQGRPVEPKSKKQTRVGSIEIDEDRHEVRVNESPINVTGSEFQILRFLATRPGFVRTREQIIEATHGSRVVMSNRTVDVHITSLRRKLGSAGELIETIRGVGYRMEESSRITS